MYLTQDDVHNLRSLGKNITTIKTSIKQVNNYDNLYGLLNVLVGELALLENCLQKIFESIERNSNGAAKERWNDVRKLQNDHMRHQRKVSYKKDNMRIELSFPRYNHKQHLYNEHALTDRGCYHTNDRGHAANTEKQITFPLFNDYPIYRCARAPHQWR